MKNYLKLSNLSNAVERIIPCLSSNNKSKKVKKEKSFVVLNSDNNDGFYVRRLTKEINRFGLKEQPKILRKRSLKNIYKGDLIVFGDCNGTIDYDYRVETNVDNLDHLDGRQFKAYDLINDFDKILKRLGKYVAANDERYIAVDDEDEPRVTEINVDVTVSKKHPKSYVPLAILLNDVCEEKVTIFDNWVKVGYNQYDIYVDFFGNEFVYIGGNKYFVKEDLWGRKYLTK